MSELKVVDSSGWLEFFADSARAELFAPAINDKEHLIVPVISIYEVFKKILRERGEDDVLRIAASIKSGRVIDITFDLIIAASYLPLPLADSLIYAVAQEHGATLWTQDAHFAAFENVRYLPKPTTFKSP